MICQCPGCRSWQTRSGKYRVQVLAERAFPDADVEQMGEAWRTLDTETQDAMITKVLMLEQGMPEEPHNWWIRQLEQLKEALRPLAKRYLERHTWFLQPEDVDAMVGSKTNA